eukprot:6210632-Pleurochrysis_carterae.AAC.1
MRHMTSVCMQHRAFPHHFSVRAINVYLIHFNIAPYRYSRLQHPRRMTHSAHSLQAFKSFRHLLVDAQYSPIACIRMRWSFSELCRCACLRSLVLLRDGYLLSEYDLRDGSVVYACVDQKATN